MGCSNSANTGGISTSHHEDANINLGEDQYSFVIPSQRIEDIWSEFGLVKEMGKGASCSVLKVKSKGKQKYKEAALKQMKRDDEWNPTLFQTEYDILSKLVDNRNIVTYLDAWIDKSNFYLVNELLTGGELFERIRKNKKFSEKEAAVIIKDIIEAIQYCHDRNIVHRDLKPENIVYRVENGKEELVIIDFGDAKEIEDDENYTDFVGTAFYLPPEIVEKRKGWEMKMSDMWTIGVISYVLMTGRPPFYGGNHKEILKKIIHAPLKFPKSPPLSSQAKRFISALMERRTRRRLSAKLAMDHPFLNGEASTNALGPEFIKNLAGYHNACLMKRVLVKLAADKVSSRRQQFLVECFNILDKKGTGEVDVEDLEKYLESLNVENPKESAKLVMEQIGARGKSTLQISGILEGSVSFDLQDEAEVKKRFKHIAGDKDYITVDDLDAYFRHRVERASLEQMLKEIDADKDGKLSYQEFFTGMKSPLASGIYDSQHEKKS